MYFPFEFYCQLDVPYKSGFFQNARGRDKPIDIIWYEYGYTHLRMDNAGKIKKPWIDDRASSWIQWM